MANVRIVSDGTGVTTSILSPNGEEIKGVVTEVTISIAAGDIATEDIKTFSPEIDISAKCSWDLTLLERTIGSRSWLQTLEEDEWLIIERDILPVLQAEMGWTGGDYE